jgi:hypothetical protein
LNEFVVDRICLSRICRRRICPRLSRGMRAAISNGAILAA